MDAYPSYYVDHNLPLVTLFGLDGDASDQDQGASADIGGSGGSLDAEHEEDRLTFQADLPAVAGDAANCLLQAFQDLDARNASWNSRPGPGKMGSVGFTHRNAGLSITLPQRKALAPFASDMMDLPPNWQVVLHSPLSPLTPSSPLYPEGIFTPLWMQKHQSRLPAAVISFFRFTVDLTRSSLEDNALKTEINRLRAWFSETKFASRIIVVLVCDAAAAISAVVERLGNIRRATNLDTKTLLYMPGGLSPDETRAFVGSLLSNIHATCIEYYRDLSKHARRKKNRGSIPPPTIPSPLGNAQVLSARGWNLRYELKLGVLAEFRGEMDAAGRNFEQAYVDLLDGDIFENISNWSPRFDEARLLADAIAIRILRSLLWTNQTSSAAQSWSNHRHRMRDLIGRKGKGLSTYSWPAWEANWSLVMAQMIERVDIPLFAVSNIAEGTTRLRSSIYAPPEKTFSKDISLGPAEYLHFPGHWYERSVKHLRRRRILAANIPPEDRRAPGESPASALASRSHIYDTYICAEPDKEYLEAVKSKGTHNQLIHNVLEAAADYANKHQLKRSDARLRVDLAQELANQDQWNAAASLLKPLLADLSWQREGWWQLLGSVYILALRCFSQENDDEAVISVAWQMQSNLLSMGDDQRPSLSRVMELRNFDTKFKLSMDAEKSVPCYMTTFTFEAEDSCVGDPLTAQLTVLPCLHQNAVPVVPTQVTINFKGSIGSVVLQHRDAELAASSYGHVLQRVQLEDNSIDKSDHDEEETNSPSYTGYADLRIAPDLAKVYEFSIVPRDASALVADAVQLNVDSDLYAIEISENLAEPLWRPLWWFDNHGKLDRRNLDLQRNCTIDVKPRPPKLEIVLPDLRESYYTDEDADLTIRLENDEADSVEVRLKIHIFHGDMLLNVHWADHDGGEMLTSESGSILPQRDVGVMDAAASKEFAISLQQVTEMGRLAVEIEAVYTLTSDPKTIITKSVTKHMSFARPFESNYETSLGVHPAPWPSFFDISATDQLVQRANVAAKVVAYTSEPITVDDIQLVQISPISPNVDCVVTSDRPDHAESVSLEPQEMRSCAFTVDSRKHDMEFRQPVDLHFDLHIKWRRQTKDDASSSLWNTTTLPGPTLRLDFSKPRALASATVLSGDDTSLAKRIMPPKVLLTFTIENPSDYMLQFNVTMESTEQFAFAGPKMSMLQLTPFSRAQVKFTLLPFQRETWVNPVVRIADIGFGEVLRVHAAEGTRSEKGRILIWIPGSSDSGDGGSITRPA